MPIRQYAGTTVEVNDSEFLVDGSQWVPDLAQAMAQEAGLGRLSEKHWRFIACCREEAARLGKPPGLTHIAARVGLSREEVARLFQPHPERLAARLAGLALPLGGASLQASRTAVAPQED